jgi:hypothetical protein
VGAHQGSCLRCAGQVQPRAEAVGPRGPLIPLLRPVVSKEVDAPGQAAASQSGGQPCRRNTAQYWRCWLLSLLRHRTSRVLMLLCMAGRESDKHTQGQGSAAAST